MAALKCSKSKAQHLSDTYDKMYSELLEFANETHTDCVENGYTTGFFGLKLRTPNIEASESDVASKVNRTATNMRVQSSAMLTVLALSMFQEDIESAGLEDKIILNATVHDSIYLIYKDEPEVLAFINENLIKHMCMEYEGQIVPNEAQAEIGSSWATLKKIPNHSDTINYNNLLEELESA